MTNGIFTGIGSLQLLLPPKTSVHGVNKQHDTSSDTTTSDDDDSNDPGNDNDDSMDPNIGSNRLHDSGNVNQSLVTRSGFDATRVKGMSNRFAFAKKVFDNVAKVNISSITSTNVIFVMYME